MAKKVKPLSPAALKQRWDHYAVMEHATTTAWQSGYAEGLEEVRVAGKAIGKIEGMRAQQIIIAVELRKLGFEEAKIAEILQIDIEELMLL